VEAHLLVADKAIARGFYNETRRLELIERLRGQKKFASFPDLMVATNTDIKNADQALDAPQFAALRADPFLVDITKRRGRRTCRRPATCGWA